MDLPSTNVENEKKSESIYKELVKDWLKFTKTHGFDRLVISKNLPLKIFWTISLLASIGLCSFLIARIVTDYLHYEVKTRLREVYSQQVPFPAVSVCNNNPLVTPAANDYIRNYFKTYYNASISQHSDFYQYLNASDVEYELSYAAYLVNDPSFNATLRKSFGYDFLMYCLYYDSLCSPDDILLTYDPNYGNCNLINSNKYSNGSEREIYQAFKQDSGITLYMYTGPQENATNYLFDQVNPKGIVIRVEDAEYNGIWLSGVGLSPGNFAQITLTRNEVTNMPSPYSSCQPVDQVNTLASLYMKQNGVTYNRKTCLFYCQQMNTINQIGCNSLLLPILPGYPLCTNKTMFLLTSSIAFNMSLCNEQCPIECTSVTYDVSISYMDWPTYDGYYWCLKNGIFDRYYDPKDVTYDIAMQSFAGVTLFYKEIKYTEVHESASMTFVDLVAAIGGMMGLFLGFSLMVIVEVIELGIEFSFAFLKNRLTKRSREIKPAI